jgi:hypothetical protein
MTKFYIKIKTVEGKIYFPFVEGVVMSQYPCKTATEAHKLGVELFKQAVDAYNEKPTE